MNLFFFSQLSFGLRAACFFGSEQKEKTLLSFPLDLTFCNVMQCVLRFGILGFRVPFRRRGKASVLVGYFVGKRAAFVSHAAIFSFS